MIVGGSLSEGAFIRSLLHDEVAVSSGPSQIRVKFSLSGLTVRTARSHWLNTLQSSARIVPTLNGLLVDSRGGVVVAPNRVKRQELICFESLSTCVSHSEVTQMSISNSIRGVVWVRIVGSKVLHGLRLLLSAVRDVVTGIKLLFSPGQDVDLLLLLSIGLDLYESLAHVKEFEVSSARRTGVTLSSFLLRIVLVMVALEVVQVSCTCCGKVDSFTKSKASSLQIAAAFLTSCFGGRVLFVDFRYFLVDFHKL